MTSDQVLTLFREAGALLEGHFSLSSGLHSPGYLQCARVLQHPRHAQALGEAIAVRAREWRPATVLSPALGGVVIGHEVARGLETRGIFAERAAGELTLRRGFTVDAGERVVIVEDVVTTGKSTRETIDVARAAGAEVVGAASVIDRSAGADLGVPFFALAGVVLPTYEPAECPLCASGTPIVKPGSRPGLSPR
ncbi:MAG: orotate phosphoribosyltransferase [Vicinamibacterales bacterium]|jgi:orotate phosphoribosyltransferase|nr:orotate phosphoribosyltransferase [Acidobacteriota bacterium]MDP7294719.1 orotate phosphoribosyltransferase [Vicinamibacterales bacterium]MDP7471409.1 orotate phosphoribosyltransferase [Vicinamibacterales bacterium]MDP7671157.1 orotate phosphoribosyltransferase [Vicinamibacterales bacterium]HJO39947.1 orotate phosphoribosyltransferase [Vicinamibacterales bacterium]|tara:strand:+ start:2568 stop:3149 length:582 start_codon:yes stop_codon:yes gene_type:complete